MVEDEGETRILLRRVSRLVLNPAVRDVKLRTNQALVLSAILAEDQQGKLTVDDIRASLFRNLGLESFPRVLIQEAARKLTREGTLLTEDEAFTLSASAKGPLEAAAKESTQMMDSLVKEFISFVERRSGKLDSQQTVFVTKVFESCLYRILDSLSTSLVSFFKGKAPEMESKELIEAIKEFAEEVEEPIVERAETIREAIVQAFMEAFSKPTEAFARGLCHVATNYVMLQVLNVDPELKRLERRFFKDVRLLLDTNVIVGLICEASNRHNYTHWLMEATKSVGARLIVSPDTLAELKRSIGYARLCYERDHKRRLSGEILNNEIIRTYWRHFAKTSSWDDYVSSLERARESAESKYGIEPLDTDVKIDRQTMAESASIITDVTASRLESRPYDVIHHDAYSILLVQELRNAMPGSFSSPWFLTYDYKLRRADKIIRGRNEFALESSLSPDAWLEIIYPFLAPDLNQDDVSMFFVKMLGASLLPLPPTSVKDFLEYVAHELDIDNEEIEVLHGQIQKTHLYRALEIAVNESDIPVAMEKLFDAIGEATRMGMELESSRNTIRRLVEKNEELTEELSKREEGFEIDRDNLEVLLMKVEKAETSNEKKVTLENLGSYLFGCVVRWKVVARDRLTGTSELDLVIENSNTRHLFLREMGSDIPVECKNWEEPVGCSEIRDFGRDIEKRRFTYGILISKSGITGTKEERTYACNEVWDLYRDGVSVLMLNREDIQRVIDGISLVSILREKAREIRLMG